ncbi:MmgE/PrpD family protein [Actinophytocola sp.]|uniref:MmgE/PrpD family protein n=1 Tax=Actinophytocola sp. TaxID=1872138 RepID=UPI003D6AD2B8
MAAPNVLGPNVLDQDAMVDLVRWAGGLTLADVPEPVADGAKRRLLDLVAAALAGTQADGVPELLRAVGAWGGRPVSSVIGRPEKTSVPHAVLLNATISRALELDDVHEKALLHPTVATAPIALAIAEQDAAQDGGGVDGARLLTALVAAQEVMCRLGLAPEYHVAGPKHRPRGWSFTYQCGALGGALVAALLRGLDESRALDALGNAYTALAGNQQAIKEATLAIRVQQGVTAQTAVQSADLAALGITGPHEILEGEYGWLSYWHGGSYDRTVVVADLGSRWECAGASTKPYPVCRITHNAVGATLAATSGLAPGDIERIVVHVNSQESWDEVVHPLERRRTPASPMDAQFSLPYVVALTAVRGSVTLAGLIDTAVRDPEILALAARVEPVLDPGFDRAAGRVIPMPVTVDVHLAGGAVITRRSEFPLGHPENPMGWDAVEAKVWDCAAWGSSPADREVVEELVAAVRGLERDPAPGRLAGLLARAKAVPA